MSDDSKATPPEAETTGVETGAQPRDTVVTFTRHHLSYNAGESAAFTAEEAAHLAELGVIEEPPPTDPPENVDVPHVSQSGDVLSCTMGNWTGAPTSYAYQWQMDGADVGTDADSYTVTADDVGLTATCIVTATNAIGSTAAPPSVGVVVVAP
jgi:hypothetical protein